MSPFGRTVQTPAKFRCVQLRLTYRRGNGIIRISWSFDQLAPDNHYKNIMKAVIHIGTHKTGTTTIQHFLDRNRQSLKKQGVFYPALPTRNGGAHHWLAWATYLPEAWETWPIFSFIGHPCSRHSAFNGKDVPSIKVFQEKLWRKYRREIERNCREDHRVIFSTEKFSYFLESEVERLKELMDSLFDDVTIVLYLRRQPEYLVSYYYTYVAMHSGAWNIFDYLNMPEDRSILAYHQIVKRWSIFGKDKVKIRLFDKQAFPNSDLLSDFAATAGFDLTGLERVKNQNETQMGSAEVEFVRLLNARIPAILDPYTRNPRRSGQLRKSILSFSEKEHEKSKKAYHLNREEAGQILAKYREGNDWIAREYLGKEKLFDENLSMYPEEVVSGHQLTPEKCAELTAHLYNELRNRQLSYRFHSLWNWLKQKGHRISEFALKRRNA